jgi:hypothetical protein
MRLGLINHGAVCGENDGSLSTQRNFSIGGIIDQTANEGSNGDKEIAPAAIVAAFFLAND